MDSASATASRFYANPAAMHPALPVPPTPTPQLLEATRRMVRRCIDRRRHVRPSSCHDSRPLGSMYAGDLGLVYLRYRLSRLLVRLSNNSDTSASAAPILREDAETWRREALELLLPPGRSERDHSAIKKGTNESHTKRTPIRRVTLLEGPEVGARAMLAALLSRQSNRAEEDDQAASVAVAQALIEELHQASNLLDPSECDVLYGRAGTIQALLWLRKELRRPLLGTDLAVRLASHIVREGRSCALAQRQRHPQMTGGMPLLWAWHGTLYLGAAHGAAGILQTILSLHPTELERIDREVTFGSGAGDRSGGDRSSGAMAPATPTSLIRSAVDKLDDYCFPSGNLDSSIRVNEDPNQYRRNRASTDRLVQWCHGGPGHILLLLQAHRAWGEDRYLDRARQIADDVVWRRGLLRKGVGLCHGISGNAYALLELGRYDPTYVTKAGYFARFALDHLDELEGRPDRPYSLYEGIAGLAVLLIDLQLPPEEVSFPLFC